KIEAAVHGENSSKVPAAHDQVRRAAGVEETLALTHRQRIIEARNPAKFLIEIRRAALGRYLIGVLRPRRVATDLRLVVHRLTVSEGTQEHQSAREPFLRLDFE